MFNKKSEFIYKAIKNLDCFIIRKYKLYEIFGKYPDIAMNLKYSVLYKYRHNIRNPIRQNKEDTEAGIQYRKHKSSINIDKYSFMGSQRD